MNSFFQNTLSSGQWAILAMVPPAIVALYFLKLKRMPLEVPSTYLWKRSIEDMHVNSLWQRLRRSLLLFLQLLLVALAMLALLRPGWQGSKLEGQRFIFLIDNSASMSATDVEGVENRLAEARRLAGDLIDQMESGMTAMIVSFADTPQVVQEFTDNRRLLRERLATLGPTVRGTDLHGALDLADGLANPSSVMAEEDGQEYDVVDAQEATLYIFSDGRFEDVKDFSLGNLQPVYVPIGSYDATNLAIVAFTTRRSEAQPESLQAFVQVANYGDGPQTVIVELLLEGQFLDAQEMEIGPHETGSMLFPLGGAGGGDASARRLGSLRAGASSPPASGGLKARLKYTLANKPNSDNDALSIDDAAYAAMNAPKPGQVLVVSPGNPTLEVALATLRVGRLANIRFATPDLLKTADYQRDAEAGSYRLILFDRCAPAKMPRANTLFLGHLPPGDAWQSDSATGTRTEPKPTVKMPQIIDWNRAHPLLAHVELGNVDIAESLVVDLPSGGDSLIDSTAGPIGVIAPRGSFEDVLIGFEIVGTNEAGERTANTNWPRRHSFPTFWLNVMDYLAGGSQAHRANTVRAGQPVQLRAAGNASKLTIVDPTGKRTPILPTGQNIFQFHDTQQLGVYEVHRQGVITERFSVNLLDREESDVLVRPSQDAEGETLQAADIRIGHVDVAAMGGQTPVRKQWWRALLLGALFVSLLEWYIYNRRVYV